MHRITAPLSLGDQSPDVANLQDGLRLLIDRQVIQIDSGVREELLPRLAEEAQASSTLTPRRGPSPSSRRRVICP
jgi:hypothetical protein